MDCKRTRASSVEAGRARLALGRRVLEHADNLGSAAVRQAEAQWVREMLRVVELPHPLEHLLERLLRQEHLVAAPVAEHMME